MAVDLAAAKAHLNIMTEVDDTIIGEKLAAAKSWFERQLGYTLATEYPDGVPPAIDQGILLMTAHYYANREAAPKCVYVINSNGTNLSGTSLEAASGAEFIKRIGNTEGTHAYGVRCETPSYGPVWLNGKDGNW